MMRNLSIWTSHLVPLAECLVWVAHPHPVVEALALAVLQPLQVGGGAGLQLEHCTGGDQQGHGTHQRTAVTDVIRWSGFDYTTCSIHCDFVHTFNSPFGRWYYFFYFFLFFPIPSYYLLFPNPTYFFLFLPIPSYTFLLLPIPCYFILFFPIPSYSFLFLLLNN